MSFLLSIALLGTAASDVATPPPAPAPALSEAGLRGPIRMKAAQIKAYNDGLAKDHPSYIRCESEAVTGSIAMRRKVCRTNQDWARVHSEGNEAARGMVQDMNKGWTSGDRPPGEMRPGFGGG
jgi:hypothetical protein